jgi:hypothetical protein
MPLSRRQKDKMRELEQIAALVPLIQFPNYQRMTDLACAYILSQWLRAIRQRAHDAAAT